MHGKRHDLAPWRLEFGAPHQAAAAAAPAPAPS